MEKIRASIIFALLVFGLCPGLVKSTCQDLPPDLESILQKHYKSTGLEQKAKIKTLVSFGKLTQLGTNLQISIIQKRPDKYRMDVHLQEGRITQSFDGRRGWMLNPFVSPDTVEITGVELNQLRESADFDGILVNYKKLGYKISYEAAGILEGRPVDIIKLVKEPGIVLRFFLESESCLILKTEAEYIIDGMPVNAESEFNDFRNKKGVIFPYHIINRNGQLVTEIRIDTIRINENLNDLLFR